MAEVKRKVKQAANVPLETLWIWFSWAQVATALLLWPVSQLTFARDEPPLVLSLSWYAIVVSAMGNLVTAYVNRELRRQARDAS